MFNWNQQYSARDARPEIVANFFIKQIFTASEKVTIIFNFNGVRAQFALRPYESIH